MLRRDLVILVNDRDEWIGTADKLEVHKNGALHRALSIFLLNSAGDMLLQKRAPGKYHSPGLWTNTCCSHPTPGEPTIAAANRRLQEELGIQTKLEPIRNFLYKAAVSDGLIEHEFDHMYSGLYDGPIIPVPEEVSETRWVPIDQLRTWMKQEPEAFTAWFPILFEQWEQFNLAEYSR